MKPELKSGVTDFSSSPFCEAAELVDSPRGNVCSPRSLSPAAAQSHFCQASNVQSKLNEEMPQFSPSDSPVSFLSFLERFVSSAAVHVGLGRFFTLSLQPHSRTRARSSSMLRFVAMSLTNLGVDGLNTTVAPKAQA